MKETISDISHQLKTPLAALNIYNGLIQQEAGGDPQIKEFTALSEQELDRMESLVQNLLKITKLDAGTIALKKNAKKCCGYDENDRKTFCLSGKAAGENDDILREGGDHSCL